MGLIIQMLRRRLITFPFDCLEAAWGAQAESFKVLSGQKRPTKEFVYVVPLLCMSFLIMCRARRSNVFILLRHRRAPWSSRCDDALPVDTQRRGYTGNANLLFLPRRRRDEDYVCIIITRDDELWLLTLSFIFNSLGTGMRTHVGKIDDDDDVSCPLLSSFVNRYETQHVNPAGEKWRERKKNNAPRHQPYNGRKYTQSHSTGKSLHWIWRERPKGAARWTGHCYVDQSPSINVQYVHVCAPA